MSARTWHAGPPPHIGWWNASAARSDNGWRWWNGEDWSRIVWNDTTAVDAGKYSKLAAVDPHIEWTGYYPRNARVPRIDPGKTS